MVPGLEKLAGHRLDTPQTLFVATDDRTFSAAQYATWTLLRETAATLVGTEPGDTLSSWLDADGIALPHDQLKLYVSQREALFGEDRGNLILPTVPIELTWDDYVDGRDPVWDWIFSQ